MCAGSVFFFLSASHKLLSSGKREHQLRKCLHYFGMSVGLWGIFKFIFLMVNAKKFACRIEFSFKCIAIIL